MSPSNTLLLLDERARARIAAGPGRPEISDHDNADEPLVRDYWQRADSPSVHQPRGLRDRHPRSRTGAESVS
jgi:hypothetical protein